MATRQINRKFLGLINRQRSRGKRISPSMIQAALEADLAAQAKEARIEGIQSRQLGIQERALSTAERRAKTEAKAATISGIADIGVGVFGAEKLATEAEVPGPISGTKDILQKVGFIDAVPKVTGIGPTGIPLATAPSFIEATGVGTAGIPLEAAVPFTPPGATFLPAIAETAGVTGGTTAAGAEIATEVAGEALIPGIGLPLVAASIIGLAATQVDTIICTELARQGYLSEKLRNLSSRFGQEKVPRGVYNGYIILANPIVKKMRKSKRFTKLVKFIALPIIREMAHCIDSTVEGSIMGKIGKFIGIPLCQMRFNKEVYKWVS